MLELLILAGMNVAIWKVFTSILPDSGRYAALAFTALTVIIWLVELVRETNLEKRIAQSRH
jgi:hypothetical protein